MRAAAGIAAAPGPPSTALLGALPGFVATALMTGVLLISPWLVGRAPHATPGAILGAIAGAIVAAIVATRATAPRVMGTILRDVSALDRQRLATLEIRPPTAIERAIARLLGDAALPYGKDARLMRRRYPMAFALGALAFLVLAIVGLSRPDDPVPWLTAVIGGAAVYAIALAARLRRPPIELPRLSATLPISAGRRGAREARLAARLVDDLRRGPRPVRVAASGRPGAGPRPRRRRHRHRAPRRPRPRIARADQLTMLRTM